MAGGVARGVLRLVALVSVGCIVGGRTFIAPGAPTGGEAAGGRTAVGVGGNVDANISPEYPGAGPGIVGGTGDAEGGRMGVADAPAGTDGGDIAVAPGVPGVPGVEPAGCLGGFSFLRGTGIGGPPGVPGKGCLRGLPRPRCGVGPGVTPGVPGVLVAPGVAAAVAAAAAFAFALLLLGGFDGVAAAGVDGVPGILGPPGANGAEAGVPIAAMPGGIGIP